MYFNNKQYFNPQSRPVREIKTELIRKPRKRTKKKLTRTKKAKDKYNFNQLKKQLGNDMVVKLLLKLLDKRTTGPGRPTQKEPTKPRTTMRRPPATRISAGEQQRKYIKAPGETQKDYQKRIFETLLSENPQFIFLNELMKQNRSSGEKEIKKAVRAVVQEEGLVQKKSITQRYVEGLRQNKSLDFQRDFTRNFISDNESDLNEQQKQYMRDLVKNRRTRLSNFENVKIPPKTRPLSDFGIGVVDSDSSFQGLKVPSGVQSGTETSVSTEATTATFPSRKTRKKQKSPRKEESRKREEELGVSPGILSSLSESELTDPAAPQLSPPPPDTPIPRRFTGSKGKTRQQRGLERFFPLSVGAGRGTSLPFDQPLTAAQEKANLEALQQQNTNRNIPRTADKLPDDIDPISSESDSAIDRYVSDLQSQRGSGAITSDLSEVAPSGTETETGVSDTGISVGGQSGAETIELGLTTDTESSDPEQKFKKLVEAGEMAVDPDTDTESEESGFQTAPETEEQRKKIEGKKQKEKSEYQKLIDKYPGKLEPIPVSDISQQVLGGIVSTIEAGESFGGKGMRTKEQLSIEKQRFNNTLKQELSKLLTADNLSTKYSADYSNLSIDDFVEGGLDLVNKVYLTQPDRYKNKNNFRRYFDTLKNLEEGKARVKSFEDTQKIAQEIVEGIKKSTYYKNLAKLQFLNAELADNEELTDTQRARYVKDIDKLSAVISDLEPGTQLKSVISPKTKQTIKEKGIEEQQKLFVEELDKEINKLRDNEGNIPLQSQKIFSELEKFKSKGLKGIKRQRDMFSFDYKGARRSYKGLKELLSKHVQLIKDLNTRPAQEPQAEKPPKKPKESDPKDFIKKVHKGAIPVPIRRGRVKQVIKPLHVAFNVGDIVPFNLFSKDFMFRFQDADTALYTFPSPFDPNTQLSYTINTDTNKLVKKNFTRELLKVKDRGLVVS